MRKTILALLLSLLPSAVSGQVAPATLPANTAWGRLGIGAGPGQAIPFAILTANLFSGVNLVAGPTTPTAGSAAATDWLWGATATRTALTGEGGLWSGKVYNGVGFARKFDSSNDSAVAATAPNNGIFVYAENAGTNNDVVSVLGDCNASSANKTCFGANFIARNGSGINGTKLVGAEIDVEFAAGTTAGAGTGGLYINVFNVANAGAAIQTGGHSGTWANGIILDGLSSIAAGIAPNNGAGMDSLLNCGAGSFTTACAIFGTNNLSFASGTGSTNQVPVRQSGGGAAWGSTRQILALNSGAATVTSSTTIFLVVTGAASESTALALAPIGGTFKNLYIFTNNAPGAAHTYTITLRVNGSDTSITCTITDPATTCNDTTHSAAITAGQSYSIKAVGSASASASIVTGGIEFDNP